MIDTELKALLDRYERVAVERLPRIRDFYAGRRDFLVYTLPPSDMWGNVRSPEQSFAENLKMVAGMLDTEMDALPFLEPWHGVGVYACSFGCQPIWHDHQAPSTNPVFQHIREAQTFRRLPWQDNELMRLVLDSIRYFKQRVGSTIPIALTDTQSANDTASLVVDACNFLEECVTEPDHAHRLLKAINDTIIEFSHQQAAAIGDSWATPGHIMISGVGIGGLAVSDDNQSFCSADFNREFTNPYNDAIGRAFGGVAVHSCGNWVHTFPALRETRHLQGIDLSVSRDTDPAPCDPASVAQAMAGSNVIVQARCAGDSATITQTIQKIARRDMRLVLKFTWPGTLAEATRCYRLATEQLQRIYG